MMGYDVVKIIITFLYMMCSGFSGVMLIWWLILLAKHNADKAKRKKVAMAVVVSAVLSAILLVTHLAVAVAQYS